LAEPVEASGEGVELGDHVFFLVGREFAVLDADRLGPFGETLVRRRQPPGQRDDAPPQRIAARRAGYRERVEDKEIDVQLDEAARVPIERDRAEHAKKERLVLLVPSWPQQVRSFVG